MLGLYLDPMGDCGRTVLLLKKLWILVRGSRVAGLVQGNGEENGTSICSGHFKRLPKPSIGMPF